MFAVRRNFLIVGVVLVALVVWVAGCGGGAPASNPQSVPVESYPGGVPPSEMQLQQPTEGYPGGVRPTDVPPPAEDAYPAATTTPEEG